MSLTSEFDKLPRTEITEAGGLVDLPIPIDVEATTTLTDRPALTLANLKLRLSPSDASLLDPHDVPLTRILAQGLFEGDKALHNWFTDNGLEGGNQIAIPETVITGIVRFVAAEWASENPADALAFPVVAAIWGSLAPAGVESEKEGDVSITYSTGASSAAAAGSASGLGYGRTSSGAQFAGIAAASPYWHEGGHAIPPGF